MKDISEKMFWFWAELEEFGAFLGRKAKKTKEKMKETSLAGEWVAGVVLLGEWRNELAERLEPTTTAVLEAKVQWINTTTQRDITARRGGRRSEKTCSE